MQSKFEEIKKENVLLSEELTPVKADRQKYHQMMQSFINQNRKKNVIFKSIMQIGCNIHVNIHTDRVLFKNKDKIGVIAKTASEDMADKVFKNLNKLTGSRIKNQPKRKVLMVTRSEFLNVDKTLEIFVKNDSIKIGINGMRWNGRNKLQCGERK